MITDPATGQKKCVHCEQLSPTEDHLETHNHRQCEEKGLDARTFYRKDHLRQHLRLMHGCEMLPSMESWKSVAVNINSRCGFCAQRFTVWQERVDHLTAHFKAGARMSEWKGCRGLDPAVAAQVTNAMPPYLIGVESKSPVPYSATNRATWRTAMSSDFGMSELSKEELRNVQENIQESHNGGGKATCWEILTIRLGKYANRMAQQGTTVTDEMLQAEARRILYDSDDAWNQTAADNPEWLNLFKKAHGLDFIPNQIGGQGKHVPADLETYGDLGLRIPFCAQLKAYNDTQGQSETCTCPQIAGAHTLSQHTQLSQELRQIYQQLAHEGVLHGLDEKCTHHECDNNVIDVTAIDSARRGPKQLRWCIYTLPKEKAGRLLDMAAVQGFRPPMSEDESQAVDKARQRSENFHRSLEALIKMDDRLDAMGKRGAAETGQKAFLQRHKYALPATGGTPVFATTTPPWTDSGAMPATIPTTTSAADAARIFQQEGTTTTGAMTEFLGGGLTGHLPFASDTTTSQIPSFFSAAAEEDLQIGTVGNDLSWMVPRSKEEDAQMLAEFDRLIAETAVDAAPAPTQQQDGHVGMDAVMEGMGEVNFGGDDLEMDFDGVFDMPVDETFVPATTSGAGGF